MIPRGGARAAMSEGDTQRPHLSCPTCGSYDVARLFVASAHVDACLCAACGAHWDEDPTTGACHRDADRASVIVRREG